MEGLAPVILVYKKGVPPPSVHPLGRDVSESKSRSDRIMQDFDQKKLVRKFQRKGRYEVGLESFGGLLTHLRSSIFFRCSSAV